MPIQRYRVRQIKRLQRLRNKRNNRKNTIVAEKRYCSVKESLASSLKEVKLMQEGKIPKRSLDDLFKNIDKWANED